MQHKLAALFLLNWIVCLFVPCYQYCSRSIPVFQLWLQFQQIARFWVVTKNAPLHQLLQNGIHPWFYPLTPFLFFLVLFSTNWHCSGSLPKKCTATKLHPPLVLPPDRIFLYLLVGFRVMTKNSMLHQLLKNSTKLMALPFAPSLPAREIFSSSEMLTFWSLDGTRWYFLVHLEVLGTSTAT